MLGEGRFIHCGGRGIKAAERSAHAAELVADVAAGFVYAVHDCFDMGILNCGRARTWEIVVELQEVLHPYHLNAALGKVGIVLDSLFLAALLGVRTCGGLHHTVIQGQAAELPWAEDRREIGVGIPEVIVLRVQSG